MSNAIEPYMTRARKRNEVKQITEKENNISEMEKKLAEEEANLSKMHLTLIRQKMALEEKKSVDQREIERLNEIEKQQIQMKIKKKETKERKRNEDMKALMKKEEESQKMFHKQEEQILNRPLTETPERREWEAKRTLEWKERCETPTDPLRLQSGSCPKQRGVYPMYEEQPYGRPTYEGSTYGGPMYEDQTYGRQIYREPMYTEPRTQITLREFDTGNANEARDLNVDPWMAFETESERPPQMRRPYEYSSRQGWEGNERRYESPSRRDERRYESPSRRDEGSYEYPSQRRSRELFNEGSGKYNDPGQSSVWIGPGQGGFTPGYDSGMDPSRCSYTRY